MSAKCCRDSSYPVLSGAQPKVRLRTANDERPVCPQSPSGHWSLTLAVNNHQGIGKPEDMADVVAFLASEKAALDHRCQYSRRWRLEAVTVRDAICATSEHPCRWGSWGARPTLAQSLRPQTTLL